MPWGFAAVAVATIGAAYISSESAEDAAHATSQAANDSNAVQREVYRTTRADLAPYRDAGAPALQRLMYLSGTGPSDGGQGYGSLTKPFSYSLSDFSKDPGYEFQKAEGEKALDRGALARGNFASTASLKNLMRFNQDLASTQYGAAYNRAFTGDAANKQQSFNVLSYLAGTGQNAAAMTGQAGVNMAAGTANANMAAGAGQAQAALISGQGMNNAIQGGLSNYMYQQRYDAMMQRMPVFGQQPAASSSQPSGLTGGFESGGYPVA